MELMGVGYQELIVVMVLLLVVVGPERLPAVAYQVGRAVRQMYDTHVPCAGSLRARLP